MPSIHIQWLKGATSAGGLTRITVHGVATTDIGTVRVSLGDDAMVTGAAVENGSWTASFAGNDLQQFSCGRRIQVDAVSESPHAAAPTKTLLLTCHPESQCPQLDKIVVTDTGNCGADLLRPVTVGLRLTTGSEPIFGEVTLTNLATGSDHSSSMEWPASTDGPELVLAEAVVDVPGGWTYSATATLDGTDCVSEPTLINVPPCRCPRLTAPTLTQSAGGTAISASAQVQFTTESSEAAVTAVLELIGPESDPTAPERELDRHTGSADFTLSGTASGLAPGRYKARVRFDDSQCGELESLPVDVGAAPDGGDDGPGDGDGDGDGGGPRPDGGDNGGGRPDDTPGGSGSGNGGGTPPRGGAPNIPWCLLLLLVGLCFAIFGALALGIGICLASFSGMPAQAAAVFAGVAVGGALMLFVGTVLLIVWMLICGSCRANCRLMQFLIDVLSFLVVISFILMIIGAILARFNLSTLCWLGWLIDLVDFALLLVLAIWFARIAGCLPWSDWVPRRLRLQLPDWMRVVCGEYRLDLTPDIPETPPKPAPTPPVERGPGR